VNGLINAGRVYIFRRFGGTWSIDQVLEADIAQSEQAFGESVAIHNGTVVVGAWRYDVGRIADGGAVFVYEEVGGNWVQQAKLITSDVARSDRFGRFVAIENSTIVATLLDDDNGLNAGGAYVFERDGGSWQQSAKLLATDGSAKDGLGFRVSISDGLVAIGAHRHDASGLTDAGAVYLFRKQKGVWQQTDKLTAFDADAGDNFGIAVSLSGSTLLIGSELVDYTGAELDYYLGTPTGVNTKLDDVGAAYFFDLERTN
jgi:hypothetical protein